MQLPIFEKYIDELIEKSTLDVPAWNIEKAGESNRVTIEGISKELLCHKRQ